MGHLIPAGSGIPQYRRIEAHVKGGQPALPGSEEEPVVEQLAEEAQQ